MPRKTLVEIIDEFVDRTRDYIANDAVSPLADCIVRKGPQHGVRLGSGDAGAIFVRWNALAGEDPAGSGNAWFRNWTLSIIAGIPNDETDPETCEETRLELAEQLCEFLHRRDVRALFGQVKVGQMLDGRFVMMAMKDPDEDIWRVFETGYQYRTLRSGIT